MARCEYNPETGKAAMEPPSPGDCPNEATVAVGADGQWHLCHSCESRPEFRPFRRRKLLAIQSATTDR